MFRKIEENIFSSFAALFCHKENSWCSVFSLWFPVHTKSDICGSFRSRVPLVAVRPRVALREPVHRVGAVRAPRHRLHGGPARLGAATAAAAAAATAATAATAAGRQEGPVRPGPSQHRHGEPAARTQHDGAESDGGEEPPGSRNGQTAEIMRHGGGGLCQRSGRSGNRCSLPQCLLISILT